MTGADTAPDDDVELRLPLDTVCAVALRARAFLGKSASSAADEGAQEDDPEAEILEDRDEDAVEQELRQVIDDLDEEAQCDLVALMWLGRDDGDWATLRTLAEQEHTGATADYLLGTPLLSDHLLAGLDRLGLECSGWSSRYL